MQQLEYDNVKKCQLQMKRELIAQGKLQMHELAEQIIMGWEDLSEIRLDIFGHYPDVELPQSKQSIQTKSSAQVTNEKKYACWCCLISDREETVSKVTQDSPFKSS